MTEIEVMRALYRASQAGVPIDLLVRGMCVLRPGVPGVSENIRVRSIVGRFLEHSRIYVFENGGDREVHIASADWMGRNLDRRVELAVPVLDPVMAETLASHVLTVLLADNVKSRELTRGRKLPPLVAGTRRDADRRAARLSHASAALGTPRAPARSSTRAASPAAPKALSAPQQRHADEARLRRASAPA